MAGWIECDRCGAMKKPVDCRGISEIQMTKNGTALTSSTIYRSFDFCYDCTKIVERFLRRKNAT